MDNAMPYVAGSVSPFITSKTQTLGGASTHHGVLEGEKKPHDYLL